jgi:hypothetical protein
MAWRMPSCDQFWQAVEIYLAAAYDGACPPTTRSRVDNLREATPENFYQSSQFEPVPKEQPVKYCFRLGNHWYPHMKLVIERAPDDETSLFRADTHDRHIQVSPESKEYAAFCELMGKNQALASRIESDWEAAGVPTFKSFLRRDLARRQAGQI